ncbi:MAG: DNA transfer protein p32, partial [Acinetobacter sp.]
MKKTISLMATAIVSTVLLAGCQNMSPSDQRIGAAALGGAVGGGVGNHVGGGLGAGVGAAAGAGVGSNAKGGSRNTTTSSAV